MRNRLAMPRGATRGFGLIEVLVVMVIIIGLSLWFANVYLGKGEGKIGERVHTPMARTQETVCASNLDQVRKAVMMLHDGDADEKYPASLSELKFPTESLSCPDGHEPYQYDPSTGQVHCVHPGHENL